MTLVAYIKTPTEPDWTSLYRAHLADQIDGEWRPKPGVQIDVLGVISHQTGVDPQGFPILTPRPGWHVNVTVVGEFPSALHPFLVNPLQPKRIYFGTYSLAMPEPLPEAGGTMMITRGIGQQCPDEVIARIEKAVLLGRLAAETAADRIALIRANLALVEARERAGEARAARDAAVAARDAAVSARDTSVSVRAALISERDAQAAIRADAISKLTTLTGAARAPEVARRDAAVAELGRLLPLLDAATVDQQAKAADVVSATTNLDAARAAVDAANAEIVRLRAERDALRSAR